MFVVFIKWKAFDGLQAVSRGVQRPPTISTASVFFFIRPSLGDESLITYVSADSDCLDFNQIFFFLKINIVFGCVCSFVSENSDLTMGQWVVGHGSNGSTDLDGSHGLWVSIP